MRGTYTIDPKRSTVFVSGTSSVHPIEIRSVAPEGELAFDDGVGAGSLVVPVKSLRTGQPFQDLELRRQIQARRFPAITATLRALQPDGTAVGDISFFGNTQAAAGQLTVADIDDDLTIAGEATFDVRSFGFEPPNILGVRVHPEVTVRVDLVAVRQ
jgi:polyisoprenoid-binding protein YceI